MLLIFSSKITGEAGAAAAAVATTAPEASPSPAGAAAQPPLSNGNHVMDAEDASAGAGGNADVGVAEPAQQSHSAAGAAPLDGPADAASPSNSRTSSAQMAFNKRSKLIMFFFFCPSPPHPYVMKINGLVAGISGTN